MLVEVSSAKGWPTSGRGQRRPDGALAVDVAGLGVYARAQTLLRCAVACPCVWSRDLSMNSCHECAGGQADEWMLRSRAVFINGHLDDDRAFELQQRLIMLDDAGNEPIWLHIFARDGALRAVFTVVDAVEEMRSPVHLHIPGRLGGAALAFLGPVAQRRMSRHATLLLTEPQESFDGNSAELALREIEYRWLVDALYSSLAAVTGKEVSVIHKDAERKILFNPVHALEYGFIEQIT